MPVSAPARGAPAPGWPRREGGKSLAAGVASVLAHLALVAVVLHPPLPRIGGAHHQGGSTLAVTLAGAGMATSLDRSIATEVAPVAVRLRAAPVLPALALPVLPQTALPAAPAPVAATAAARPVPSPPDGLRMAHLQAVRAALAQLTLDLRALDLRALDVPAPPAASHECHEVMRQQLACDEAIAALPEPLRARLLFQARQSRALGLSGDRLEIPLGEGRVLAVNLQTP